MRLSALERDYTAFKKAVIFSLISHLILFLLIILSPYFPKPSRKGMVHYVNVISLPGGGGGGLPGGAGGGGEEKSAETEIPRRETLRDLTTPQKPEKERSPSLRHPVEKPEKETASQEKKKTVIQKKEETRPSSTQKEAAAGKGEGSGSGVRIGVGTGKGGGTGFQSTYSSQIGLSSFPFTYYLQIIIDRVSSNWFTSLVDPGMRGNFQTTVFFKIYRSGSVSDLKIEESSGVRSLDLSALRAIQSAAPFPPLPKEYTEQYLGIHLIFEHSK
ncbi:MAG: energy transducer TonB [Candidatus Aminicenantes bacterium]